MTDVQKFRLMKQFLPRDYAKAIAEKHGVTRNLVWMVAKGTRNNPIILADIIAVAKKCKAEQTKLEKQLNTVII